MAVINRNQLRKNKSTDKYKVTEQEFLAKAEDYKTEFYSDSDLTVLSLDDLANQYIEIDRQSHLLKGKILLEARSRFPSDKEFGQWISTHSLCVGSQQVRNRLMHLADFFDDTRDMSGISITAAYAISSPLNRSRAIEVYAEVHGKNLPVKAVKDLLVIENDIKEKKNKEQKESTLYQEDVRLLAVYIVDKIMLGKSNDFKLDVLNSAISYLTNGVQKNEK